MSHESAREPATRSTRQRLADVLRAPALPWLRDNWFLLVAAFAILAYFGPSLAAHVERSANPLIVNDDVRILIWPFFRFESPPLPDDAIGRYYLDSLPDLYRALYIVGAKTVGAIALSKTLPYVVFAATTAALVLAARRLAGPAAAIVAAVLTLGSSVYLARMVGGLPRGFAFPLLAVGLALLAYGNVRALAVLTCAAAGFYPVTAVVLGLSLAGVLVALPARDRGSAAAWPLRKRLAVLAGTAALAALVVAPAALRLRHYGAAITPAMTAEFPEAGPGGRFLRDDRPPFPGFLEAAYPLAGQSLFGAGEPFVPPLRDWLEAEPIRREAALELLLVGVVIGWARLAARQAAARRVLVLGAAALLGHLVAQAVLPRLFLPQRYVQYVVPVLATLLAATFWAGIAPQPEPGAPPGRAARATVVLGSLLLLAVFAGSGTHSAGLNVIVRRDEASLHEALQRLPSSAVIAGWPSRTNNIPYFARRRVLLSWELHMPFHTRFTELMRARMRALIRANYATDRRPLDELRERFGVTHLLIDRRDFGTVQSYFKPFDRDIDGALRNARGKQRELVRQVAPAAIWQRGTTVLLDLNKLAP